MNRGCGERTLKRLDDLTRREGRPLKVFAQCSKLFSEQQISWSWAPIVPTAGTKIRSKVGSQRSLPVRNTSDGCDLPQILTVEEPAKFLRLNVKTVHAAGTAGKNGVAGGGP